MKRIIFALVLSVFVGSAEAGTVTINWGDIGGPSGGRGFHIAEIGPIQVTGFVGITSEGWFENTMETSNSTHHVNVLIWLGGNAYTITTLDVAGPAGSIIPLDGPWLMQPNTPWPEAAPGWGPDLEKIRISAGDSGNLFGLNAGEGTNLIFSTAVVPIPAAFWLFGSALGLLGLIRKRTR